MAKNYASIDAQNVTFDTVHNNAESQSKQSDLKVGMFARVISPIIDLAQAAESTLKDQEASDRVKAAQLMGLAAQGYNVANTINNVAALPSNGVNQDKAELFRAEFGVGMSHSRASQMSKAQISQGNTVNAKQIEITARSGDIQATQTDFTSRGENGESLQDNQRSNSNSLGLGSKVEFGFGTAWEFSGNASATSGKANSKQVTEQSGLFAGEGGKSTADSCKTECGN